MLLWPLDFLGGLALGAFFFVSLWLSVRALPKARHPVVLALASFWGAQQWSR
jgi:F1F0 ATPase subunit 2